MNDRDSPPEDDIARQRDAMLRRALATPPISNEDILQRSKESRAEKSQEK